MKKILKLTIGIIAGLILFLYLVIPFVKVDGDSFIFAKYLNEIFKNIGSILRNSDLSQIDMLYSVLAWLVVLVIICVPVVCLVSISFKAIVSGIFTKRNLKLITVESISFISSTLLIMFCYFLINKYELPADANGLQLEFVRIACHNIWQPLVYISAFGSLFLLGLNIYVNGIKKKKEVLEEE